MDRIRELSRTDGGFTALELMAVVAIIGILLLIAVASYVPASGRAASVACSQNRAVIDRAYAVLTAEQSVESSITLSDLAPYISNYDSATTCPSDGTVYTFDAVTGLVTCPNHP